MADIQTQSLDPLYARNPGSAQTSLAAPAQAAPATSTNATAGTATSTGYTPKTGLLSDASMADTQLNKITAQDSPLMQQARQQGMLTAASRGLQNSSIAAGNSEAEAVKAATPLALQNSQLTAQNEMTDKAAENTASQFGANAANTASGENAQLQTSTNLSNSTEANKASALNAQLQTNTNQFNTSNAQNVNNLNAAAENEMRTNVLNDNATFNRQYLAGTQSMDLTTIQQQYQQLISSNTQAAQLYQTFFSGIQQAMASNIAPDRMASMIDAQQTLLQHGLDLISAINEVSPTGSTSANPASPNMKTIQPVFNNQPQMLA